MSQYLQFAIGKGCKDDPTAEKDFTEIMWFTQSSYMFDCLYNYGARPQFEECKKLDRECLEYIKDYFERKKDNFKENIDIYKEKISHIEKFNNSVFEKLNSINEIYGSIEEIKQEQELLEYDYSMLKALNHIWDAIPEYSYIYYGFEVEEWKE